MNNESKTRKTQKNPIENLKKLSKFFQDKKLEKMLKEVSLAQKSLNTLSNSIEATTKKKDEREEYKKKREERAKKSSVDEPFKKPFRPQQKRHEVKRDDSRNKKDLTKDLNIPAVDDEFEQSETRSKNKFGTKSKHDKDKEKKKQRIVEKSGYNKRKLLKQGIITDDVSSQAERNRRFKKKKKIASENATVKKEKVTHAVIKSERITVKVLSERIGIPASDLVKNLFILGIKATINSSIDFETAELVASEFDVTLEKKFEKSHDDKIKEEIEEALKETDENLPSRSPIVTVMGHVDHGKTSLLDHIRQSELTTGEAGGITQSIGAYRAKTNKGKVTFIDTPGHSAFTEMRARGAKVTDIAVLVVAADDGVMPQTIEAINHIKAADVPMVVAINKIDKTGANPDRIKQQLADNEVLIEEWGGDTIAANVSAITGEGVDELIDMILLVSEMQNIKANPDKKAIGTIIESHLDRGKGPMATVIVQNGTLNKGDTVVSGISYGKVRALINEKGEMVNQAGPSTPVVVLGLNSVPLSGDYLNVVDERHVKQLVYERQNKLNSDKFKAASSTDFEDLFDKAKTDAVKDLNIIIKADSVGVVEALKQSLVKLENEEFKINCVHQGVGAVNETDVLLAEASSAHIISFNVRPDANAKKLADAKDLKIKFYNIIYDVIEDIKLELKGMLSPKYEEVTVGEAEVIKVYKSSKLGSIAGSKVTSGKIVRNLEVRLVREGIVVAETIVDSIKIESDDKKEVKEGFECGIKLKNYNDIKEKDIIQVHEKVEITPE